MLACLFVKCFEGYPSPPHLDLKPCAKISQFTWAGAPSNQEMSR